MRRVWGCTPASSAATLMMYTALSSGCSRFFAISSSHLSARGPDTCPALASDLDTQPLARRLLLNLLQPAQQLLLLPGELLRNVHLHRHQQIPRPALPRPGRALSPDAERLARGRPRGNLQGDLPIQGRYTKIGPQRSLRVGDGQLQREVRILPSEQAMGLHADRHEQISCARTWSSSLPPSAQPDPCPVPNSGRDPHGELAGTPDAPRTAALLAWMLHDPTGSPALGARAGDGEEALVHRHRARPSAGWTRRRSLDPKRDRRPRHGLLEGHADFGLQVGALGLGRASAPASASTGEHAEQVADPPDVSEVIERKALDPNASSPWTRPTESAESRRSHLPDLVVLPALFLVGEAVVRRGDLLEAIVRLLLPGVGVRVVLLSQLPVGLLDVPGRRVLRDPQDLVVVLFEPLSPDVTVHGRPPVPNAIGERP